MPAALKDVGFRTIKAFGAKSRFFHCEFFQLNEDKPGLGKKGDYVALEVNMRPAGGYTPDMINYANSVDCYQIWADMVCYDEVRNAELDGPKSFRYACSCTYRINASRSAVVRTTAVYIQSPMSRRSAWGMRSHIRIREPYLAMICAWVCLYSWQSRRPA